MKKAVFTINFGGYDPPRVPYKTKGWDYICLTDNLDLGGDWELREIDIDYYLPHIAARYGYINSQKHLPDYDLTLMVGGQIKVDDDVNKFIARHCDLSKDINLMRHPCRTCIYDEARTVVKEKIDKAEHVDRQMAKYRDAGFPKNFGLSACGIIIRHNSDNIRRFEENWWREVQQGSYRDQLSFDFVRWKMGDELTYHWFPYDVMFGRFFSVYFHGTERRIGGL